jgi:4-amino-4-deoxy-L-arabinose transferase-like glycosyltransferase
MQPKNWWQSRTVVLAIALHGFLFLGLFQLGYTHKEWNHIKTVAGDPAVAPMGKAIMSEHGPWGFVVWYYSTHEEAELYYRYAKLTLNGDVDYWVEKDNFQSKNNRPWPYRDIPIEYQPGALLTISLPALLASDFEEYRFWLSAWLGFLYLFNLFMGIHLVTGGAPSATQMNRMLWWSLGFLILLGGIVTSRFDHVVVTCILLSTLIFVHALRQKGNRSCYWFALFGFVTAIGVLTKIVPGLVMISALLVLLIYQKESPRFANAIAAVVGLGIGLVVLNVGFYAVFGTGYLESFTYHMDRGIQIETVYAGVLLLARMFGYAVTHDVSYGSSNVVSSLTGAIKLISPVLFLTITILISRSVWKSPLSDSKTEDPSPRVASQMILLTLILLLAFMLTNKVFSPQYMIWVGPLMAVLISVHPNLWKISGVFLFTAMLSQVLFPHLYDFLNAFHPAMVITLNVRNGLLILILFLLIRDLPKILEKNHLS